jgi:hypothetical protein
VVSFQRQVHMLNRHGGLPQATPANPKKMGICPRGRREMLPELSRILF